MRNLKKILALVLALVMSMSLMATANAAFSDESDITGAYNEAVKVMSELEVFRGMPDGSFAPQENITRAQVAAMVYRIATADVDDSDAAIHAGFGDFEDVPTTSWAAGYIGFCANAKYITGYGNGKFGPNDNVTGYQALAMILRAIGYGREGEFQGKGWEIRTAALAESLGILRNIGVSARKLSEPATREMVAEILFRAILVPQASWTPALGYVTLPGTAAKDSLAYQSFQLFETVGGTDAWGRPQTRWMIDVDLDKVTNDAADTLLIALPKAPTATFTVATPECEIAEAVGLTENETYDLYVNGKINKYGYIVQPTDTIQKIGGQGTLVEVYGKDTIVTIDTLLARVEEVREATYDLRGHRTNPATIRLEVYTDANTTALAGGTEMWLTNGDENYTYVKGDMVLVNSYMNTAQESDGTAHSKITTHDVKTTSKAIGLSYGTHLVADYATILGVAESMVGAQTFLWYNNSQHTVEGENYNDAKWFALDQAVNSTGKYTWYFDQYGNLIGSTEIATQYTYGIIENIQWQNPSMAAGYAMATLRYMDGTTETKVVTSANGKVLKYSDEVNAPSLSNGYISTTMANNASFCGVDLFRIATAADGTVALEHVFTDGDANRHNYTVSGGVVTTTAAEIDHLASATIKGNTTTTALAAIVGTRNSVPNTAIYTNSNTVFLIQTVVGTTVTYTVVQGYENMKSYNGTATVDYVNVDGDTYADFVYVTGTPIDAVSNALFFLTDNNVKAVPDGLGGIAYYEINGILEGQATTIKAYQAVAQQLVPSAFGTNVNCLNMLFGLHFTNGIADDVNAGVNTYSGKLNLFTANDYKDGKLNEYYYAPGDPIVAGTVTYDGQVLKVGSSYFNVVGQTPVFGEWSADMSNKRIYVIYDNQSDNQLGGAWLAKAVYIVDVAGNIDPSEPAAYWTPHTGGFAYNLADKLIKAPADASVADLTTNFSNHTLSSTDAYYFTTDSLGVTTKVPIVTGTNDGVTIGTVLSHGGKIVTVEAGTGTLYTVVLG